MSLGLARRPIVVILLLWFALRRVYRLRKRVLERALEPTDVKYVEESVIVKTSLGRVRGYVAESPRKVRLANFRGIPFAAPPVKELRFKHAIPPQPWDDKVLNCTRFGFRSISNPTYGVEHLILPQWQIVVQFIYRLLFGWGLNTNPRDPHPRNPQQCTRKLPRFEKAPSCRFYSRRCFYLRPCFRALVRQSLGLTPWRTRHCGGHRSVPTGHVGLGQSRWR